MKIRANGLDIEVEDSAAEGAAGPAPQAASRPAVLLIMGLGMQLVAWPPELVQRLVHDGFRVIRFDNRDIGLSQKLDHLGQPSALKLMWSGIRFKLGLPVASPYTLQDMARDALGVLDALGIARVHVAGVSMGGMIAQQVAVLAPERVLSLSSIMSSSGAPGLPQARPQVLQALLSRPNSRDPQAVVAHYVNLFRVIGSPGFAEDQPALRERIVAAVKRNDHPAGALRQFLAVVADGQRAAALARIRTPTLVIHGKADPLLPFACGEDTARRIPGARLVGIEGMGHDLPPGVVARLLDLLLAHFANAATQST